MTIIGNGQVYFKSDFYGRYRKKKDESKRRRAGQQLKVSEEDIGLN